MVYVSVHFSAILYYILAYMYKSKFVSAQYFIISLHIVKHGNIFYLLIEAGPLFLRLIS